MYSFSILGDIDPGTLSLNGHDNIDEFIYIYICIFQYIDIYIYEYIYMYIDVNTYTCILLHI
jgi:hypothetical protein